MPDRGLRAATLAAALTVWTQAALACEPAPTFDVVPVAPAGVALRIDGHCPYARLTLTYGPFRIVEEVSVRGALEVTLPRLPRLSELTVAWQDGARTLLMPPAPEDTGVAALVWTGAGPGPALRTRAGATAMRAGFPVAAGAGIDFVVLPPGETAALVFDASPETCGATASASVLVGAPLTPETVSVAMPPCDGPTAAVRVPLPR